MLEDGMEVGAPIQEWQVPVRGRPPKQKQISKSSWALAPILINANDLSMISTLSQINALVFHQRQMQLCPTQPVIKPPEVDRPHICRNHGGQETVPAN
jgi:hypothetical protein